MTEDLGLLAHTDALIAVAENHGVDLTLTPGHVWFMAAGGSGPGWRKASRKVNAAKSEAVKMLHAAGVRGKRHSKGARGRTTWGVYDGGGDLCGARCGVQLVDPPRVPGSEPTVYADRTASGYRITRR